ncbi:aerolysin family beta-barrel pore-forming toxin [Vibrio sp. AND4]|uniref:aerolysin family beta-barrel pore-forming toxin n=1 Tax=Vibrio sp. AND4 TaxID=314289 RepID=UPI00015EFC5C|nr:aerolysin family beta-barrel pore-forming toxin [Vibrio sp. AND4]EDP59920.1 hemolysin [Vibrio sp. AND4]
MLNVSTLLTMTLALSLLSTFAHSKVFSDQLVIDEMENHQCRSGYRQLNHQEALEHRNSLLSRMQTWDIVGLENGWVIMGTGYHGKIKPEQASDKTWCYPIHPNAELPRYPSLFIPGGNVTEIEQNLVTNDQDFIRPISYLAHTLGYAWLGGNDGQFVGEDMLVRKTDSHWEIQGNNSGSCTGYRCKQKTKITIKDFAYRLNPKHFSYDAPSKSPNELIKSITAYLINAQSMAKHINVQVDVGQSKSWYKTDNSTFAQSVHINNRFQWPKVGSINYNVTLDGNQTFSEFNKGTDTDTATREANLTVSPHSILPIKIDLYRSHISYPFRIRADISYRVDFDGFLRHDGNAWFSHPDDRPTTPHTFTMGRSSEVSENIRYQWDHRYIPGKTKWWDWSWAIHNHGLDMMQYAAGASLRPYYSHVSGTFEVESQYAGMIDVGKELTVDTPLQWAKDSSPLQIQAGDVTVKTDFDAGALAQLGFHSARLLVQPID